MSCIRRRNSALARKIATLQLPLKPLFQMPAGPPHTAFPRNIMAFHLLTEDQLDSIAHYYHQSTPGHWTNFYPASMNWDKEFLTRHQPANDQTTACVSNSNNNTATAGAEHLAWQQWAYDLMQTLPDIRPTSDHPAPRASRPTTGSAQQATNRSTRSNRNRYAHLSAADRIRIKRRKVGKFIGLRGMETPTDEIVGRVQASWERAVQRSREQLERSTKG